MLLSFPIMFSLAAFKNSSHGQNFHMCHGALKIQLYSNNTILRFTMYCNSITKVQSYMYIMLQLRSLRLSTYVQLLSTQYSNQNTTLDPACIALIVELTSTQEYTFSLHYHSILTQTIHVDFLIPLQCSQLNSKKRYYILR